MLPFLMPEPEHEDDGVHCRIELHGLECGEASQDPDAVVRIREGIEQQHPPCKIRGKRKIKQQVHEDSERRDKEIHRKFLLVHAPQDTCWNQKKLAMYFFVTAFGIF